MVAPENTCPGCSRTAASTPDHVAFPNVGTPGPSNMSSGPQALPGPSERRAKLPEEIIATQIQSLVRPRYTLKELDAIRELLLNRGTFRFPTCATGLFPAAGLVGRRDRSGYQYCWVRDNVHVAHALYATGDVTTAVRATEALLDFFRTQRSRFRAITEGRADPANPMDRPHIRFDGERLAEVNQRWSHAQNDALGYFLWLYCRLARLEPVLRHPEAWECLHWFPAYLDAIRFWEDPDSGHWEEVRKVSASSIGAVVFVRPDSVGDSRAAGDAAVEVSGGRARRGVASAPGALPEPGVGSVDEWR